MILCKHQRLLNIKFGKIISEILLDDPLGWTVKRGSASGWNEILLSQESRKIRLFGRNQSPQPPNDTLSLHVGLSTKFTRASSFQTPRSNNFNSVGVAVEAASRAGLLQVRSLRAVEQMHTINSGYFRLVAFWSSSSFFVTFSFGGQRCLVTGDAGEGLGWAEMQGGWEGGQGGEVYVGVFLGGPPQKEECWEFAFEL